LWVGDELAEERDITTGLVRRFYANGTLDGTTLRLATGDHLGSVRHETDAAAVVSLQADYDSFGRREAVVGPEGSGTQFQGYFAFNDLLFTQYRVYDPELGRWLSEDPLRWIAGPNLYAFVNSNPVNSRDPTGLCTLKGSRTILSFPGVSKEVYRGPWSFDGSFVEPPIPGSPIPDMGGSIVQCKWFRLIIDMRPWTDVMLDTYRCFDMGCLRWRTEYRVRRSVRYEEEAFKQKGLTKGYIPLVFDAFVSPDEKCIQWGAPPW
jgi:RHS repeat-associated protein